MTRLCLLKPSIAGIDLTYLPPHAGKCTGSAGRYRDISLTRAGERALRPDARKTINGLPSLLSDYTELETMEPKQIKY